MRFILTDYQAEAAGDVAARLRRATREFSEDGEYSALSLTAPTGAGKTVIATAVIESLFLGDEDAPGDPDATVLWITDMPSLNEQTKRKMLIGSTGLKHAHLVTVDEGFDQQTFDRNRVYFLNIQKLSTSATFVQSGTDGRRWSLWETIGNTIRERGGHFYVVIDEAHRGTGSGDRSRPTIVSRIISDPNGVLPPAPVVWGISATPERFREAMERAASPSRTTRTIAVDPEDVRASGLLKDVLDIRHPDESQPSAATLTRAAAASLREMSVRWKAYSDSEDEPLVRPALVVQVVDQASDSVLGEILEVLGDEWSELNGRAIAHSFESHATLDVAGQPVRYIAPEDIQDDKDLRVVLFKQALTTGWDCPRAEVMLSFRRAEDYTYIAQLIGRMVRTPLARQIPTDDLLNSVSLFLPLFDKESVDAVVERLRSDPNGPTTEIQVNSIECIRNTRIPTDVTSILESLPTYVVPGRAHRSQVARLRTLAARLARDGIRERAVHSANKHLIATIEREREALEDRGEMDALIDGLYRIDIGRETVNLADGTRTSRGEHSRVDSRDINRLFGNAKRGFRDGLANDYWSWLLDQDLEHDPEEPMDPDQAKIIVAALASDPTIVETVENAAEELVQRWLKDASPAISHLPDAAKAAYQQIRASAKDSELAPLILPTSILANRTESTPTWGSHVYTTPKNGYPANLNTWEAPVLETELARGVTAWYRNPTGGERALRIPYQDTSGYDKPFYPDFVFFHQTDDGIKPSIVDPHNYTFADTGPKWRGLAAYAKEHGDAYQRIDAVIVDPEGALLRLDLKDPTCRKAIQHVADKDAVLQVFREHGGIY